ncbi:DUF1659 domain-containing protein [Bacillus sp. FJAT-52991]|uniref:DUF1659 domain-containing protein n=1 Tax=Bacillus kandeliae TaxID=3129297 RepID=A0ABZ2NBD6_9BACI
MAVIETPESKALIVEIFEGMDTKGKEIIKKHTFRNVALGASADSVHSAAEALTSLYMGAMNTINVVNTNELTKN